MWWWDASGVFERFTEPARQVVVSARREARELRHSHVGSEHLLLGLLREDEGLAARALASLDVTLDRARVQVRRVGSAQGPLTSGEVPVTPRATQVALRAREAAARLGHYDIGTEHILLGLASLRESEAMNALQAFDVDAEQIRTALTELLCGPLAPASVLGAASDAHGAAAAAMRRCRREASTSDTATTWPGC